MMHPDLVVWDGIQAHLRNEHPALCRRWFNQIEVLEMVGGVLHLRVPNPVHLRYLQHECSSVFNAAVQAVTGRLVAVRFVSDREPGPGNAVAARKEESSDARSATISASVGARSSSSSSSKPFSSSASAPVMPSSSPSRPRQRQWPSRRTAAGGNGGLSSNEAARQDRGRSAAALDPADGPHSPERSIPRISRYSGSGRRDNAPILSRVVQPVGDPSWGAMFDDMVINPDYAFENFVVGPTNRLAHAAAIAVADNPGRAYNPYFVHGGVGLGKTHLLQAICQHVLADNPDCRIYYVSCEGFMGQFMEAVQEGQMAGFRHRFRHMDILVVDDIHDLAGHDRTQEEFFHTFNSLYQAGKQIVLSCDAGPSEIPDLEDRLLSRFKSGLVARLDKPCYETRIAILKKKASLRGIELPDDVTCHVASHTDSNIRELEGALTQLQGYAMATGRPIDIELAREVIDQEVNQHMAVVSIQSIIALVSQQFGVKHTDLLSKRRHKSVTLPRQVAMSLARQQTNHSLQEIGGYFGGRDHTTVMHAVSKIAGLRQSDEKFNRRMEILERSLLGSST